MTRKESWDEYLDSMIDIVSAEFRHTKQYYCQQEKRSLLDDWIASRCPKEKREFFENCVVELELDAERRAKFYYRQGIRDGIRILRELGVAL